MGPRPWAASLALGLAAAFPAGAQEGGSGDLARRTFANAEQLLHDGKVEQALRDYRQVAEALGDSPYADDALLRIASIHYPIDSIAGLGVTPPEAQARAAETLAKIRERYPQGNAAPEALFRLGLLRLEPESPYRNLDEAYAAFTGVVNIYPESRWVPRALLGAAMTDLEKGDLPRALLALDRALDEGPTGRGLAEISFLRGRALAPDDPVQAAEAFQAARLAEPDGPLAGRALDWLTLLYRRRLAAAGGGAAVPEHDPSFVPSLPPGEEIRGEADLAVAPDGRLLVADRRRGALVTLGSGGGKEGSEEIPEIRSVTVSGSGKAVVTTESGVRLDGALQGLMRRDDDKTVPIGEPTSACRDASRRTRVLAMKDGEVLEYGSDPSAPRVLHRDKDAGTRIGAIAAGPGGRAYLLDRRGKNVLVLGEGGAKPVWASPEASGLQDPVDLDVDPLGDIYVLDARARAVLIYRPDGSKLAAISPPEKTPAELEQPAALAVGRRGEVYIHDERKKTILRFR